MRKKNNSNGKTNNVTRPDQTGKPAGKRVYNSVKPIAPRNQHQREYLEAIEDNVIVVSSGPAGTGKTYLAVYAAVCHHWSKKDTGIERLIITRPAVEADGEKLGFLPGPLDDKMDPYMRPIYDSLYDIIGVDETKSKLDRGFIEIAPIAFMRGRTFNNAFVIVDEAQNASLNQLKMVVTRVGENCKLVINGDPSQCDLRKSGLPPLEQILEEIGGVAVVKFDQDDIVRHKIIADIVAAFGRYEKENGGKS
jgi:phosphate starvation-inducible PhoH-like protein